MTLNSSETQDVATFLREMVAADLQTGFDPASLAPLYYWSGDQTTAAGAGTSNDLSAQGGIGYAAGQSGSAFLLDGVNDRLTTAAKPHGIVH